MNNGQRQHYKDTLLCQAKAIGLTDSNFLACTLTLSPHQAQDIQQALKAFKSLNIDAIGAVEYQLTKAGGYHIHFTTKKENTAYLLENKLYVDIQVGYDLNGWLWYLTKNQTTHYIQTKTSKANEKRENETTAATTIKQRNEKKRENETTAATNNKQRPRQNEQKGVFELAFIDLITYSTNVVFRYKKAPT